MSVLKGLKLSAAKPDKGVDDPKLRARAKLVLHLPEQKAMAEAELAGKELQPTRMVYRTNDAGERVKVEAAKRLRCDWFTDAAGNVQFQVRYGNKPIELAKGMSAIEAGKLEALPGVIQTIIQAVNSDELDAQLQAAVADRKKNFKRKTTA